MAPRKVTVFGGTGFLGQRVVQRLLERDFSVRVAVRHFRFSLEALCPAGWQRKRRGQQVKPGRRATVRHALLGLEGANTALSFASCGMDGD